MIFSRLKTNRYCTLLLLAYFACGNLFLSHHAFSHQFNQISNSEKLLVVGDNFSQNSQHKDISRCNLCDLLALQNQLISPAVALVVLAFYLALVFLISNSVKLFYLLPTNHPRAPPAIS